MALRPAPRPQPPLPAPVTDDTVLGNAADNTLAGGAGNDSLDGGAGFDTVDYSALGAGVTLRSQGLIDKGNGGTDSIANIERIIGAAGQGNFIDGAVADPASQTTSFVVDLSANSLVVNGIPFLGTASFVVENFIAVRGTANADDITGSAAANTFLGSAGNDAYDGGDGVDLLDYAGLGGAVTLRAEGVIDKGAFGQDSIVNVEAILGAAGFANRIDGSVADPAAQTTSFAIDLSLGSLVVNGIPGLGSVAFGVAYFTEVTGTNNADSIRASSVGNTLAGAGGDDTLAGGLGDDLLDGGEGADRLLGSGGSDAYVGGGGVDLLDYAGLGGAVTLRAEGVIDKAGLGQDSILGVEGILGAAGYANRIDGTVADPSAQTTSFAIDLSLGSLVVNGIPGLGSLAFGVAYFTEVTGTNNADSIRANSVGNTLAGAGGNDTLVGGLGNDRLEGGLGADSITLGAGRDVVVFNNAAEGGDTILDFFGRDDEVQLSASGFGLDAGPLLAAEFAANRAGAANRAQAQFVYDTDGGQLYFDADGTGAGQAVLLGRFQGAPTLSLADLVLIA